MEDLQSSFAGEVATPSELEKRMAVINARFASYQQRRTAPSASSTPTTSNIGDDRVFERFGETVACGRPGSATQSAGKAPSTTAPAGGGESPFSNSIALKPRSSVQWDLRQLFLAAEDLCVALSGVRHRQMCHQLNDVLSVVIRLLREDLSLSAATTIIPTATVHAFTKQLHELFAESKSLLEQYDVLPPADKNAGRPSARGRPPSRPHERPRTGGSHSSPSDNALDSLTAEDRELFSGSAARPHRSPLAAMFSAEARHQQRPSGSILNSSPSHGDGTVEEGSSPAHEKHKSRSDVSAVPTVAPEDGPPRRTPATVWVMDTASPEASSAPARAASGEGSESSKCQTPNPPLMASSSMKDSHRATPALPSPTPCDASQPDGIQATAPPSLEAVYMQQYPLNGMNLIRDAIHLVFTREYDQGEVINATEAFKNLKADFNACIAPMLLNPSTFRVSFPSQITLRHKYVASCLSQHTKPSMAFMEMITHKEERSIESLHLSQHRLGDNGLQAVLGVLPRLYRLHWLDLSLNELHDHVVPALVQAVRYHPALEVISLERNHLTDACLLDLMSLPLLVPRLKALKLAGCQLTPEGLAAVQSALASPAANPHDGAAAAPPVMSASLPMPGPTTFTDGIRGMSVPLTPPRAGLQHHLPSPPVLSHSGDGRQQQQRQRRAGPAQPARRGSRPSRRNSSTASHRKN